MVGAVTVIALPTCGTSRRRATISAPSETKPSTKTSANSSAAGSAGVGSGRSPGVASGLRPVRGAAVVAAALGPGPGLEPGRAGSCIAAFLPMS